MRIAILISMSLSLMLGCAGDEVDPGNGSVCMMRLYDPCNEEHDCNSGMCHLFQGDGFQVCTQACDDDTPCPPDLLGNPATCNNQGICKPVMAHDCRIEY
jgi:hypothetical protein